MRRRAADHPVNIRQLQRSLMLSSGAATKRLDRLEAAGLIERLPDPTDRRGVLIALSAKGRAVIMQENVTLTSIDPELLANRPRCSPRMATTDTRSSPQSGTSSKATSSASP